MIYVAWAILLISQSFSNTLVSRARNSSSLAYHSVCSLFSNGVWFVSLFILVDSITTAIKSASAARAVGIGVFYTTFTLIGSVGSHWIAMRYFEKGKRSPSHGSSTNSANLREAGSDDPVIRLLPGMGRWLYRYRSGPCFHLRGILIAEVNRLKADAAFVARTGVLEAESVIGLGAHEGGVYGLGTYGCCLECGGLELLRTEVPDDYRAIRNSQSEIRNSSDA